MVNSHSVFGSLCVNIPHCKDQDLGSDGSICSSYLVSSGQETIMAWHDYNMSGQ